MVPPRTHVTAPAACWSASRVSPYAVVSWWAYQGVGANTSSAARRPLAIIETNSSSTPTRVGAAGTYDRRPERQRCKQHRHVLDGVDGVVGDRGVVEHGDVPCREYRGEHRKAGAGQRRV